MATFTLKRTNFSDDEGGLSTGAKLALGTAALGAGLLGAKKLGLFKSKGAIKAIANTPKILPTAKKALPAPSMKALPPKIGEKL